MAQSIAQITVLVNDYDEAVQFYTEKLNFTVIEDTVLSDTKRWVVIAPKNSTGCCLLLAKASDKEQKEYIGNQTGGRVFLFLYTDNFWSDYNSMVESNINFIRQPTQEIYGMVAVFEDLYGNLWDLVESASKVLNKSND